tara:strand:+ start:11342 stop:11692 length:351 start_codon:yes stop_codon:yes gene_type:complete
MNTNTIKTELTQYIQDNILLTDKQKNNICDQYLEDLNFRLFNEDYYIIGYYKAEQWLKKHNISVFAGIEFVQDYERENFGEDGVRNYDNAEKLVNMIVYIIGEELIYQEDYIKELI